VLLNTSHPSWFGPVFLALEGSSTLKAPRRRQHQKRSHSHQKAIHKLEREEEDLRREINHLEGSTLSWRRRKTPSEGKP
jgi:cell division protein FtsB